MGGRKEGVEEERRFREGKEGVEKAKKEIKKERRRWRRK